MSNVLHLDRNGFDEFFDNPSRKNNGRKKRRTLPQRSEPQFNTSLKLKKIEPKTDNQGLVFDAYARGKHIVELGVAGTGKSFVALYLALNQILNNPDGKIKKVIIVRSAVQGRDQGFLPGNIHQKMAQFEMPYVSICKNLFGRADAYEVLKKRGIISFESTSFLRGETWDNAVVMFDEIQNANFSELLSLITRVGDNSRVILCGDHGQNDLVRSKYDQSGLVEFMKILQKMREISVINFTLEDVVRSGFVKSFYRAMYSEDRISTGTIPTY